MWVTEWLAHLRMKFMSCSLLENDATHPLIWPCKLVTLSRIRLKFLELAKHIFLLWLWCLKDLQPKGFAEFTSANKTSVCPLARLKNVRTSKVWEIHRRDLYIISKWNVKEGNTYTKVAPLVLPSHLDLAEPLWDSVCKPVYMNNVYYLVQSAASEHCSLA